LKSEVQKRKVFIFDSILLERKRTDEKLTNPHTRLRMSQNKVPLLLGCQTNFLVASPSCLGKTYAVWVSVVLLSAEVVRRWGGNRLSMR
jgi:hypothetical protein